MKNLIQIFPPQSEDKQADCCDVSLAVRQLTHILCSAANAMSTEQV